MRRFFFGAAAIFFGAIALRWHDGQTWQSLSAIWSLPSGRLVGDALMIVQIAGGAGLLFSRTVRFASILLIVVYALFSLACIPGIVAAPKEFDVYDGFFEQFCLLCGVFAVFATTEMQLARALAIGRIARIGLGVCMVSFTLAQIVYFRPTVGLVPTWIPPNPAFWAMLTTVAFGLAAVAILTNRQARLALSLMTLMLTLFGILVWIPRLFGHPQTHLNWSEFALTWLIAGAAWVMTDVSEGRRRLA